MERTQYKLNSAMPAAALPKGESKPSRHGPIIGEFLMRYLAVAGLCFWMGGFTFYAGVVIHVGHRVFERQREIGFLTRDVTLWLNRSGVVALLLLGLNYLIYSARRTSSNPARLWGGSTLAIMVALQAVLFALHPNWTTCSTYLVEQSWIEAPSIRCTCFT
jgi:hypothetical protein